MSVLTILLAVTVIFAQGVSSTVCHCTNGCQSVPGTPCTANSSGHACIDDWFGKYCQIRIDQWHDNDMDVMVSGQLCQQFERSSYVTGATLRDNPLDVTCSPPIRGRNVTIAMNVSFLSLCEVQVFVCSDGWFGKDCNNQCQCRNKSEICDKDTGYCRSKCPPGKMDFNCLQVCGQQHYGVNCNSSCGQCSGSLDCLKENGTCTNGCKDGYNPPICQECVQGFCGPSCTKCGRCKNSDACYIHNGTCLGGCESGYLKPTCLQVCHDSWFGTNCTKKCKCNNITEVCDKANGNCRSGCLAGKRRSGCQDGTASLLKNENSGHKTDVRFIIVCCLMVVLGVYSAAATTLVFRLKQKVAKTNAELEKQYVSLEPRGDSSVYDVIAGAHTYCNDVQPEDSDYENTTRNIMKRGEHSL